MACLKNDVLLKLLDDMRMDQQDDGNNSETERKPVLLQIRSIVPVLEEGALWPNKGFFLKVSDSSHALYVSLPEDQNEMILGNKLKLGQFMYVQKLESSDPVPVLRGVTPVPGRRSCEGTPEEILSPVDLVNVLEHSHLDSVVEKGVILEKKIVKRIPKSPSDSESSKISKSGGECRGRCRSSSASKVRRDVKKEVRGLRKVDCSDMFVEWPKSRPSSADNDSDVDSLRSFSSMSKRRSWNESEMLGGKEIFDSSVVKHDSRRSIRSQSANVSPVRSVRDDSSDDSLSWRTRRKDVITTKRLVKGSTKTQMSMSKAKIEQMSDTFCGLLHDRKGAEAGISWNSLPSNLMKFGKEVIKQRDNALLAASDALQEACAAERLLTSLSTLSEFPMAKEGDDLQPYVDKFFDFQDDLSRTRLILQSLTSISPLRTPETELCSTNSIKETLSVALERNKNASSWLKTAVALDLSPCAPAPLTSSIPASKKKSSVSNHSSKPKGSCIVKSSTDFNIPLGLTSEREEQPEWTKGSSIPAGLNLAASLQDEGRKLFLSYVEKYLDEVERKSEDVETDAKMAGMMMYKVKKVSDWLDAKDQESFAKEDCEVEAYGRVRNKIYGILLKHVERTTMANFNT